MNTITIEEWIEKIESFEGTKFHHMGRNRHGVDCYGLLLAAASELDIADPSMYEVKGYRKIPGIGVLESQIGNFLIQRPYDRLQPLRHQAQRGDILVFTVQSETNPKHMAVYLGVGDDRMDYIAHADAGARRVVKTQLNTTQWRHCIHSVWYSPRIVEG